MARIIGGALGGRRIAAPPGAGTRPTSDRVREAIFSALEARIELDGVHVLDLYAGSGALGLEAASRGAARVVLVEHDRRAAATIRRNVADLGLDGVVTVAARAVSAVTVIRVLFGSSGPPSMKAPADASHSRPSNSRSSLRRAVPLTLTQPSSVAYAMLTSGWAARTRAICRPVARREDGTPAMTRDTRNVESGTTDGRMGRLSRRSFLVGTGTGLSALGLAGCVSSDGVLRAEAAKIYGPMPEERFPIPATDISRVDPKYFRRTVPYPTQEAAGTIIVDPANYYVYRVEGDGTATRYGANVGRDGFRWSGDAYVGRKSEWATWTPPTTSRARWT